MYIHTASKAAAEREGDKLRFHGLLPRNWLTPRPESGLDWLVCAHTSHSLDSALPESGCLILFHSNIFLRAGLSVLNLKAHTPGDLGRDGDTFLTNIEPVASKAPPTPHTLQLTLHNPHPTPYTAHPTPHTLHHIPYTVHPTPCTLHPIPSTLHPSPSTPHPTPHTPRPSVLTPSHPLHRERERERECVCARAKERERESHSPALCRYLPDQHRACGLQGNPHFPYFL